MKIIGIFLLKALSWLLIGLGHIVRIALLGWATLALYYSPLPAQWFRISLAAAFFGLGIYAFWVSRRLRVFWTFVAVYILGFVLWQCVPPSNDRKWRREVAVMPRVLIDGDRVRISGYRNFEYRSTFDFTERYEEREFLLSHLTGVDFYISYFMPGPVAHTFLSFCFDNQSPLCISIETRPEVGEGFDPVASLFKQFELIYVVGDERDIVGVRTNHRGEDVYLYRLRTSPEKARELLLVYLDRINQLADHPEWYHLLSNSCTINIVRYANLAGRQGPLDYRHVLNGWIDRYFYNRGYLDTVLPFDDLRRQSKINSKAQGAEGKSDFAERIRVGLLTSSH